MPSGKSSKQRRQQAGRVPPPPVRTKGQKRARQASPRALVATAAVVAVAAVAVVLVAVLGRSSSDPLKGVAAVGTLHNALPGASDIENLFKGIPQTGTTLGNANAPLTMTEFIDPQCPYCREFETTVLPSLVTDYVRTGKVRIQMEPWAFIGPDSVKGQAAELAAARQNRAFNYAELLYFNQGEENTGWLSDKVIASTAASIPGVKVPELYDAQSSAAVKAAQKKVDGLAGHDHITGTPTIYVGKTGTPGTEVAMASPTDKAAVVAAFDRAL